ncbi:MAG TPA: ATP-binding protein [Polyangiaceae bacterium]|nr:ATP-binding protein [Polyangiaceae bacterium]
MHQSGSELGNARSAIGVVGVAGVFALCLFFIGPRDYPQLHTVLDTGIALLSGVLGLLLWDLSSRINSAFPRHLALSFAITSLLELVHVIVTIEWTGPLSGVREHAPLLRPATWPPAAHLLPLGICAALWLLHRRQSRAPGLAVATIVAALGLLLFFEDVPSYTPPIAFGITRPSLLLVPMLWAVVAWVSARARLADRMMPALTLTAMPLLVGHVAMLYSRAPHDTLAMIAHLGKLSGYLSLLLSLMSLAARDLLARLQMERELEATNASLEQRVTARTAELEASNQALEDEALVRRTTEQKVQAQLQHLNLLHQITRAIGERQDLNSIFQVVIRSVEEHLPLDFACVCTYDPVSHSLTVVSVGIASEALALGLAMPERATVPVDENGLSRCVRGELVYEPDITDVPMPFPQRLACGGLRSLVAAPLLVESQVFGVVIAARLQAEGFTSSECEFLKQLSEHAGLAAHHAQLYSALQIAYDDLRQTQQAVMQQERLRALGQMASGIAHDINNAISPAALYAETLLDREENLSADARDRLETIKRAIDDVGQTVGRLGEFYRQRERQLPHVPVDVSKMARQVIDLTRARWSDMSQRQGIAIRVQTEFSEQPITILGVESEIREALTNLVLNAVDAMPEGGTLTLRTRTTDGPALGSGERNLRLVLVEVEDTGLGMDEDVRRRCLEPFFTTKGTRGTGLGLAMVYGVVMRHGGEIEIDSGPGRGTTMRLKFTAPSIAVGSAPELASRAPSEHLRILIVDDDPLILKSLRDALESDGHLVTAANGGRLGIEEFKRANQSQTPFAVVITDLGMPDIDGRKVASAVKSESRTTPVILLTGWGQRLVTDGDVPPNVDRVLNKPPRLRELRDALHVVGRR